MGDEITERRRINLKQIIGRKIKDTNVEEYFSFFQRHSIITIYFEDGSSIEFKS
jgi:hypothetical protein